MAITRYIVMREHTVDRKKSVHIIDGILFKTFRAASKYLEGSVENARGLVNTDFIATVIIPSSKEQKRI